MSSIYLFTYGLMRPGYPDFPKTTKNHMVDSISGDLYDLGSEPAGVNFGRSKSHIIGDLVEIDSAELPRLDRLELGGGQEYRRVVVRTDSGRQAYAYEYMKHIPAGSKHITEWRPRLGGEENK